MAGGGESVELLVDALSDLLTQLFLRAHNDTFRTISELDLSMSQCHALTILHEAEHPPSLQELAGRLGLSVAATGRAVESLVRSHLVHRNADAGDRRVKRVSLSEAGQEMVRCLATARHDDLRRFAAALTEPDRVRLTEALAPLVTSTDVRSSSDGAA